MSVPVEVTWARTEGCSDLEILKLGGEVKKLFGRSNWRLDPDDVVSMIEQSEWSFYIVVDDERVWLEVEELGDGEKRLELRGDLDLSAVLLRLPDAPNQ